MSVFRTLVLVAVALSLTGCIYRMPEDGEVRTVPNTNNPHVIGIQDQGWEPTVSY